MRYGPHMDNTATGLRIFLSSSMASSLILRHSSLVLAPPEFGRISGSERGSVFPGNCSWRVSIADASRHASLSSRFGSAPLFFINMAGTFSSLQLNSQVCSAPSIPLVLQSDYQWNNSTSTVEKRGSHADDTQVLDHELQLVPEAIDMLKTIQKPVAVLAICGPYRSGKSFFISRVVGKPGTFKLGHSMDGCTRGIWLSTTALECEEFVLLVLDTEGIGAVEGEGPESFTTKLLVTTILLSSFLVYNSMEVPKQADLQQMRYIRKCVCVCVCLGSVYIHNAPTCV